MKRGFSLVARLGPPRGRYPHILVDAHCWVLRLGPNHHRDDKYYSSLPSLLEGMVEHVLRRRLGFAFVDNLGALARKVKAGMKDLRDMATSSLKNTDRKSAPMAVAASSVAETGPGTSRGGSGAAIAFPARECATKRNAKEA